MPSLEELASDPRWRPFSVLVLLRGKKELVRCPTPGHLMQVKAALERGEYAIIKTSTQGEFTLERQLDEMLEGVRRAVTG